MMKLGLYSTDVDQIRARIEAAGLTNVYSKNLT
jgi:hypothetical protein